MYKNCNIAKGKGEIVCWSCKKRKQIVKKSMKHYTASYFLACQHKLITYHYELFYEKSAEEMDKKSEKKEDQLR